MTFRTLRFREFLKDDAGAEIVEFAIVLASFTVITMSAISVLGNAASYGINLNQNSLSAGAVNPP
jgi:Flp pilus assembly pilin Flp